MVTTTLWPRARRASLLRTATLLALAVWACAGCGQKGPLVLPPEPSPVTPTTPAAPASATPQHER